MIFCESMPVTAIQLFRVYQAIRYRPATGILKRSTRYPGIVKAAKELGVNRVHLYLVLRGDRVSYRLMHRYQLLQKTMGNFRKAS